MSKKIKTEEEVKSLLKIDDWRSMSKEKIMDFVSLIPNMDREVSLAAIEQFPNYVTMSNSIVDSLIKLCDNSSKEIVKGTDKCLDAYRLVLESLSAQLNNKSLSAEGMQKELKENTKFIQKIKKEPKTEDELIKAIKNIKNFEYTEKYKKFNEKFNYLDDGQAAKRTVEKIMGGKV